MHFILINHKLKIFIFSRQKEMPRATLGTHIAYIFGRKDEAVWFQQALNLNYRAPSLSPKSLIWRSLRSASGISRRGFDPSWTFPHWGFALSFEHGIFPGLPLQGPSPFNFTGPGNAIMAFPGFALFGARLKPDKSRICRWIDIMPFMDFLQWRLSGSWDYFQKLCGSDKFRSSHCVCGVT